MRGGRWPDPMRRMEEEENNILLNQHSVYIQRGGRPASQPTCMYTQSSKNAPHRLLVLFSFSAGRRRPSINSALMSRPPATFRICIQKDREREREREKKKRIQERRSLAKCLDLAFANEWKGNDSKQADARSDSTQTRFYRDVCLYKLR